MSYQSAIQIPPSGPTSAATGANQSSALATIAKAFVEQGATNWKVGILARPEEGFDEELDYENLKTNEVADTAHARRLALQMAWKWIKRKTRVLETEMHG